MQTPSTETIELCNFKLNTQVDKAAFLKANEQITTWLEKQAGFQYRCLSTDSTGRWCDIVQWVSMEAAKTAADAFMAAHGDSDFIKMIDQESLCMNHFDIQMAIAA